MFCGILLLFCDLLLFFWKNTFSYNKMEKQFIQFIAFGNQKKKNFPFSI
jgi:hypothetical protein